MSKITVSYTTPDPSRPQPASPIELDASWVYYRLQFYKGIIQLKDTKGEPRDFQITTDGFRPILNDKGNQTGYSLSVILLPLATT